MITKVSKPIFLAVGSVILIALGVILGQSVSSIVNAHGGDPNSLHFCVNTDNGLIIMVRGDTDCGELRGNWQPVDKTVGSLVSTQINVRGGVVRRDIHHRMSNIVNASNSTTMALTCPALAGSSPSTRHP